MTKDCTFYVIDTLSCEVSASYNATLKAILIRMVIQLFHNFVLITYTFTSSEPAQMSILARGLVFFHAQCRAVDEGSDQDLSILSN